VTELPASRVLPTAGTHITGEGLAEYELSEAGLRHACCRQDNSKEVCYV